jgi:hypothetical protein
VRMDSTFRNRLVVFGLVWGLALAAFPAVFAFDDPFTVSPFLVAAFLCAALAGAAGALTGGKWLLGRSKGSGAFTVLFAGILHGTVCGILASLSIWVCLAVNISGFSAATPGDISNLLRDPGIFFVSGVAALAVLLYSLVAGVLLSPVAGFAILRASGGARRSQRLISESS